MPKNITTKNMNRMFPFEFYDEIHENLKDYVLSNPAFMLNSPKSPTEKLDLASRKKLYNDPTHQATMSLLHEHNIIDIEPFGEVLILDVCTHVDDLDKLTNQTDRSQIPMSMLIVQLYDSSDNPVFASDVSKDTIEQIPEVLWDDPNLMMSIVTIGDQSSDGPQVGVIKIPKRIEDKILETI